MHYRTNPFPSEERDVVIGGDINANRYDRYGENFWTGPTGTTFPLRTLSPDNGKDYSPTRLSGVPLLLRNSKIDYLLVWDVDGRCCWRFSADQRPRAHELLAIGTDAYRANFSDHLPVTVRIQIGNDDD